MGYPNGTVLLSFNPDDPKYKCCCQSCHVKTGTTVWAVVQAVFGAMQVLRILSQGALAVALLQLLITGAILGCLFYGLHTERSRFLLPSLVMHAISIGFIIIGGITLLAFAVFGSGTFIEQFMHRQSSFQGSFLHTTTMLPVNEADMQIIIIMMAVAAFLLVAMAGFHIWLFTIVLGCYRYFCDKALSDYSASCEEFFTPTPSHV